MNLQVNPKALLALLESADFADSFAEGLTQPPATEHQTSELRV